MKKAIVFGLCTLGLCLGAKEKSVGGIKIGGSDTVKIKRKNSSWGRKVKHPIVMFSINTGTYNYVLRYNQKASAGVGIASPTRGNWYESGMITVFLNGKKFPIGAAHKEKIEIKEGNPGRVRLSWENATARVTFHFLTYANDDKLFLAVAVKPKLALNSAKVMLTNYPGAFDRDGNHEFITAKRTLKREGKKRGWTILDPAAEKWLFYSNYVFDAAGNDRAAGPCGLVLLPDNIKSLKVYTGGYSAATHIVYQPGTKLFKFCFREYAKKGNREALVAFKESVPATLKRLKALDKDVK